MPSQLTTQTLQAAALSAVSNLLAQGIKAYQSGTGLNLVSLAQFVVFTLISCPPNCLWQQYLEETFPGYGVAADGSRQLNKRNTAIKFGLDQTLGSVVNVATFIAFFAFVNGKDAAGVQRAVSRETFPLMKAGWKLWPLVSILNFTIVPVHRRILVGSVVGLFWGIYLSLIAAK
ncbi:PXMP2/4 family protein 3 [Cyphellophora attinorum]|uniref:PXMP2/4 family protein 3 n=1 Tax=Cyphellophora attinorum TaxID=1664694 RepID=A0A0N0NND1_9EURO|nr:PXMP2/4 family protein 3 [Phialophora attinorum]KPI41388.1 PXMP2/4 family protein 3 [Phialophora attinorum]